MAEHALAGLDAGQRERLSALGFELLVLRSVPAAGGPIVDHVDAASSMDRAAVVPSGVRLTLRGAGPAPFAASHAKLLRSILTALGLREGEVSEAPSAGLPTLALGLEAAPDAIAVPALWALRQAEAKRMAWPQLRRLRRQLREGR